LRDVAETIATYDKQFWSNGHSVMIMVFDDSSLANHEKKTRFARAQAFLSDLWAESKFAVCTKIKRNFPASG
jgi:hypothetical protein